MESSLSDVTKNALAYLGRFLPWEVGIYGAHRFRPLRYVLRDKPEFQFDAYRGSLSVKINPSNMIELEMATGTYEDQVQSFLNRVIKPGFVCVDVGANVGAVSLALCELVGSSGKVYCFEPGPPFFKRLKQNFSLNPEFDGRASLYPMGLSHCVGELAWSYDPSHPENGGFIKHDKFSMVAVTTLEHFVTEHEIEKVDFIKIDTEGMELEVLKGSEKIIERDQPVLLLETLMSFDGSSNKRQKLVAWLNKRGYALYALPQGTQGYQTVDYPRLPPNAVGFGKNFQMENK